MRKVIIIGINHPNTLGLIRAFGINGVLPHLILVTKEIKDNYCLKSKYLGGSDVVTSNEEALELLRECFFDEKLPPLICPSSDGAMYVIDVNHDELSRKYLLPHINNKQGEIAFLMNKYNQAEWLKYIGIKTARTMLLDFTNKNTGKVFSAVPMPCIVKPVLSHKGRKGDICKCSNISELKDYISILRKKGYNNCLLQEFVKYDSQFVIHGAMLQNNENIPFVLLQNIREWPDTGGTGCFRCFVSDKYIIDFAKKVVSKIRDYGYRGLFDIEFFLCNDEFILNEVNFRSSGVGYSMFHCKQFYPFYYYQDFTKGNSMKCSMKANQSHFVMNILSDMNYVKTNKLSIWQWLNDFRKTKDFAYFNWHDPNPALFFYWSILRKKIGWPKK